MYSKINTTIMLKIFFAYVKKLSIKLILQKDDDLDDDLDDQLLYSSEEEKEDFSKPVADLSITESSSILLSNSDQDKVNSSVILSDVPGYSMSTNVSILYFNKLKVNFYSLH